MWALALALPLVVFVAAVTIEYGAEVVAGVGGFSVGA